MLIPSDSRRLANALMVSRLDPLKRSDVAYAAAKAETFIDLPKWVRDFVVSMEKNPPKRDR